MVNVLERLAFVMSLIAGCSSDNDIISAKFTATLIQLMRRLMDCT